jgi:DNA polymerase-3 subunit epsilon
MYAIVDLETTGGKPADEAITEIAIYKFDGNEIVDQFSSLVNPQRAIQPFVVRLTGISNKMLRRAPKFYELAKRVVEITEGCVLVAHNASFDYGVLKKEFKRLGYKYERPTLCTVKLSKELIPGLPSYSLGKLCKSLHIPMTNRHRATGDALATIELFKIILSKQRNLLDRIEEPHELNPVKKMSRDVIKMIDELPAKTGLVYFYNKYDKLIGVNYVRNIQKKVNHIFAGNNPKSLDMQRQINKIDYELSTGRLINKVIAWHYRFLYNPVFSPCTKKNFKEKENFSNPTMLLVDKGHYTGEKSVILIENQIVIGYGFFELDWQQQDIEVLKKRLTPVDNHPSLRKIIQDHLDKYKMEKIIRLA